MKKFDILDGSGYIFRAYYALPELHDIEGNNVNAIYGFFRMLFSLIKEKPDYFVIALDSPEKTLRQKEFNEYKINRPELPENFKRQIGQIKKIIKELNIPHIEIPGYEADDIVYNLVKQFKNNPNIHINVISSDKDFKQFLGGNTTIYEPMKGKIITYTSFIKEFGFEPKYIVDWLALVGDTSDNIPGIQGIGPKTATQLIQKYHTIENIYKHIEDLPEKIKKNLEGQEEKALYSKKLIQLMDIPNFKPSLKQFKLNINFKKGKEILIDKLGFKSFEKYLNELQNNQKQGEQLSLF